MVGRAVMTWPTVTPASRPPSRACCSSAVAALTTNQPISASHIPPIPQPVTTCSTPRAIMTKPRTRPDRAAFTAAVCRSPRHRHKAARNTRPPSSGAAGIRLNTASTALVAAR